MLTYHLQFSSIFCILFSSSPLCPYFQLIECMFGIKNNDNTKLYTLTLFPNNRKTKLYTPYFSEHLGNSYHFEIVYSFLKKMKINKISLGAIFCKTFFPYLHFHNQVTKQRHCSVIFAF